jgi:hypothetical protein
MGEGQTQFNLTKPPTPTESGAYTVGRVLAKPRSTRKSSTRRDRRVSSPTGMSGKEFPVISANSDPNPFGCFVGL